MLIIKITRIIIVSFEVNQIKLILSKVRSILHLIFKNEFPNFNEIRRAVHLIHIQLIETFKLV
jgi:hypothetical protein